MKFISLLLLQIFSCTLLFAQPEMKNVDVKSDYTLLSYKLYAKKPLLKSQFYSEILPVKLNYNPANTIERMLDLYLSLDAKRAKSKDIPSVSFKYVTAGLNEIVDDGNYSYSYLTSTGTKTDFYKRISYNCPFVLEIIDSLGNLKKTINIASKKRFFYTQINRTFLMPKPALGQPAIIEQAFSTEEEANEYYLKNKPLVAAKIESICLSEIKEEAKKAIYSIYDFSKYQKSIYWYFEIEKKSKDLFPDVFEKTEKFKETLKNYDEAELKAASVVTLNEHYNFYVEKLKIKTLPDDVKQLCRFNAATCALFINKLKEGKALYNEFYSRFYLRAPFGISELPNSFTNLYKFHYIYAEIQSNLDNKNIELNTSLDDIYYSRFLVDNNLKDQKIEAEKKALNPEVFVYNEQKNKQLLLDIWSMHESLNTGSNTGFREPAGYIYKDGTNEIIGQKFLDAVSYKKYVYLLLKNTVGNPTSASYGGAETFLTYEYNKLISIKGKDNSDFDFKVDYNKENQFIGITSNKLINGTIQTVCRPEFENGKLIRTTKYENEKGVSTPWIRAIKTMTYTDTGIIVDCRTYFTGRQNTLKNSSTMSGVYKKSNGTSYIIVHPYNETSETFYNTTEDMIKRNVIKRNEFEEHTYFYDNGQVYKEETVTKTLDKSFVVKTIFVSSIPKNQRSDVPSYEKVVGAYKFNNNNELIYEAIESKYRNKVNGVWEDWKFFRY